MAFESLTERLNGVFKKLRGKGKLSEADIKAAMREVRMALLEADVNYKVAKDFCAEVSQRAMGQEVMESLTPAQQVVKIVNEELTRLMGGDEPRYLHIKNKGQTVLMMCGLQGNGKTTHAAKLGKFYRSQGRRPLLDGRRTVHVAGHEQGLFALPLEHIAQFASHGGFARALQAAQHIDRGVLGRIGQPGAGTAHQPGQFFVDDLDDLLSRREALDDVLAHGALRNLGHKILHDLIVNVRLQERHAHLAHRGLYILFGEPALAAQLLKNALQLIGQPFKRHPASPLHLFNLL